MLQTDAELAIRAANVGADVVGALYGGPLERIAKSSDDFATEADVASERAIMAIVREARPDDAFVGEELGAAGNANSDRSWLVDPLCGTLNYAARTPLVAVNVALRVGMGMGSGVGGGVAAAASADPFSAEVFWTDGHAAYVRSGGHDRLLAPDPANRLVDVNLDPPFPNRDGFRAVRLLQDEAFTDSFRPRVMSTTLALAWVARVGAPPTSPTDTCVTACTSAAGSRCAWPRDVS